MQQNTWTQNSWLSLQNIDRLLVFNIKNIWALPYSSNGWTNKSVVVVVYLYDCQKNIAKQLEVIALIQNKQSLKKWHSWVYSFLSQFYKNRHIGIKLKFAIQIMFLDVW